MSSSETTTCRSHPGINLRDGWCPGCVWENDPGSDGYRARRAHRDEVTGWTVIVGDDPAGLTVWGWVTGDRSVDVAGDGLTPGEYGIPLVDDARGWVGEMLWRDTFGVCGRPARDEYWPQWEAVRARLEWAGRELPWDADHDELLARWIDGDL